MWQKVRRVYGEQKSYQKNEKTRRTSSVVNNYSIVASRGELSRNNYTVGETSRDVTKKRVSFVNSSKIYAKESNSCTSVFLSRDLTGKYLSKDIEKSQPSTTRQGRAYNGGSRILAKSVSVPAILEEGIGSIGFFFFYIYDVLFLLYRGLINLSFRLANYQFSFDS